MFVAKVIHAGEIKFLNSLNRNHAECAYATFTPNNSDILPL